jgi:hypothetical protein
MGMCKYSASCHFAHGENDLKRPVIYFLFLLKGINSRIVSTIKSSINDAIN